jgi:hypothetical protein
MACKRKSNTFLGIYLTHVKHLSKKTRNGDWTRYYICERWRSGIGIIEDLGFPGMWDYVDVVAFLEESKDPFVFYFQGEGTP